MDFKGYFRCGNRDRCDPFTITDGYSRYIIRCQTVPKMNFEHVDAVCDAAMREFGVPDRIRCNQLEIAKGGSHFRTPEPRKSTTD